jgi:hypothetical protein
MSTSQRAPQAPSPLAIRVLTFDWGDTLAANYGMPYLETQTPRLPAPGRGPCQTWVPCSR